LPVGSLLWGRVRNEHGDGVEVVEWSRKWERSWEWCWREKQAEVNSGIYFKPRRDEYCWDFGSFTQLVPLLVGTNK
nr:hypothetical protein [Tanacetum cinerariifolium]